MANEKEIIIEVEFAEGETMESKVKPFYDNLPAEQMESLKEMFASNDKANKTMAWGILFGLNNKKISIKDYMVVWYLSEPNLEHLPDMLTTHAEQEEVWKKVKETKVKETKKVKA